VTLAWPAMDCAGERDVLEARARGRQNSLVTSARTSRTLTGRCAHVAMGSLADEPSIRPTEHIFVGSKAAWFEIADDLPQFDGHAE
jgi:hypothetical protein